MDKKYFITGDLEKTLTWWVENIWNKTSFINEWIRENLCSIINTAFDSTKIVEYVKYSDIYSFFKDKRKNEDFIIALDDEIYIEKPDFNFSSNRVYNSQDCIIKNPNNYDITKRNGEEISLQNNDIINNINICNKNKIVICDDWLFSGDTLKKTILDLREIGIIINEIRVVLNFLWKDTLLWIPITSMYSNTECIDWIDERDLFFWTKNWWASFYFNNEINGLPYIYSEIISEKKASITKWKSNKFCKDLLSLNIETWEDFQKQHEKTVKLQDLNRIKFLQNDDNYKDSIINILKQIWI